jgi:hypothetical protein
MGGATTGGTGGTEIGGMEMGGSDGIVIGGIAIGGCGPGVVPRLWQVPCWQLVPAWVQVWFAQQGCPTTPQGRQVPALVQIVPSWQGTALGGGQQGCCAPPQPTQVPPWQVVLPLQLRPAQHGSPGSPQWTQTLFTQIVTSPNRLQRSSGQQTWPWLPHTWQVPLLAQYSCWSPLVSQVWFAQQGWPCSPQPGARQVPEMQSTPALQKEPPAPVRQQGWPTAVTTSQTKPALQLLFGAQQGAPAPPQPQVPLKHWLGPAWQVLSGGQQGCRVTPHAWQVPPRQPRVMPKSVRQVLLSQQTWPGAPQGWQVPLSAQVRFVLQAVGAKSVLQQTSPLSPQCAQVPPRQTR